MSKRKTTEEFIAEAISVKEKEFYDYSKVEYKNSKTPVLICLKHDRIFLQRQGCPLCDNEEREDLDYKDFIRLNEKYLTKY